MTANVPLGSAPLLVQDVVITLRAPLLGYAWNLAAVTASPPCDASSSSILASARYTIGTSANILQVTIPMGSTASSIASIHYVSCVPKASYFISAGGVAVSSEKLYLTYTGLCPRNVSVALPLVGNRDFGSTIKLQSRPDIFTGSVGINETSEFELRLTGGIPDKEIFYVVIQPTNNRVWLRNGTLSAYLPLVETIALNTPLLTRALITTASFSLAIDWTTTTVPMIVVTVGNNSATMRLNATFLSSAKFWFWSNSPLTPLSFTSLCSFRSEQSTAVAAPAFYTTYGTQGAPPTAAPITMQTGTPGLTSPPGSSSSSPCSLVPMIIFVVLSVSLLVQC